MRGDLDVNSRAAANGTRPQREAPADAADGANDANDAAIECASCGATWTTAPAREVMAGTGECLRCGADLELPNAGEPPAGTPDERDPPRSEQACAADALAQSVATFLLEVAPSRWPRPLVYALDRYTRTTRFLAEIPRGCRDAGAREPGRTTPDPDSPR